MGRVEYLCHASEHFRTCHGMALNLRTISTSPFITTTPQYLRSTKQGSSSTNAAIHRAALYGTLGGVSNGLTRLTSRVCLIFGSSMICLSQTINRKNGINMSLRKASRFVGGITHRISAPHHALRSISRTYIDPSHASIGGPQSQSY